MTKLLTITQAAKTAGVTRQTIYRWIEAGKISVVRTPGGSMRIYEEALIQPTVVPPVQIESYSYSVIDITDWVQDSIEPIGTKEKFWCWDDKSKRHLFKEGRPGSGENWSEKAAGELARLLLIPSASYDLAKYEQRDGVITPLLINEMDRLVLGNELLAEIEPGYEKTKRYKQPQHTLDLVLQIMKDEIVNVPINWKPIENVESALDVFIGYLMFDAWIANQDRHHENWGMVVTGSDRGKYLAPSFDHASSLGRNESDTNRKDRLTTRDKGRNVEAFVKKARSALYSSPADTKALLTITAFFQAANTSPDAAKSWLDQLEKVSIDEVRVIFGKLPSNEISDIGIDFAIAILEINRKRLLDLKEKIK